MRPFEWFSNRIGDFRDGPRFFTWFTFFTVFSFFVRGLLFFYLVYWLRKERSKLLVVENFQVTTWNVGKRHKKLNSLNDDDDYGDDDVEDDNDDDDVEDDYDDDDDVDDDVDDDDDDDPYQEESCRQWRGANHTAGCSLETGQIQFNQW